ncbi:NAD(P)-dependent oxidoreductase [Solitalea koreensis]|uniref:D-3-phosphoglycerate dehydrogenase n=1 Tax=Solitalea koreensis TaxID=543615 RepID=A0A521AQL5_9SPHI|nr:NAD(P)-dependent oxidoreductase [Solitalea koreensis]SMO37051.1 D-3-phosphoglycerate dehydrogenase [Solitalea koreensis]
MTKHILIVDQTHVSLMQVLESYGFVCDYQPKITYAEVLDCIDQYEGIVVRTKFRIERELMERATKLEFIARAGAGMDNIDEKFAASKNIALFNAPEGNRNAVAEHTLGMLLSILNKFSKGNKEVRVGNWDREGNRGFELAGRTVGIVGYGFMGSGFASKLKGLDVKILAYDKYKSDFWSQWVKEVSMEELFEKADIISLHVPLTDETRMMVDETYFNRFKKDIWFINTARGEIVNIQGLLAALKSGKVRSAALDVLQDEKFPLKEESKRWFNELAEREDVLLTPHVGGWSVESFEKISMVLADKILQHYGIAG